MKSGRINIFIILFLLFTQATNAQTVYDAHTQVELVSSVKTIRAGEPFEVAVRMTMDPGWHVYWKNPGDSGLPPVIHWNLPDSFRAREIRWPIPERLQESELTTYGYTQEVFLIAEIAPSPAITENTVTLRADIKWLACEKICIPGKADLLLDLKVGPVAQPSAWADHFTKTHSRWVQPSPWPVNAFADTASIGLNVAVPLTQRATIASVEFFPDQDDLIIHSAAQTLHFTDSGLELVMPRSTIQAGKVDSFSGILVVQDTTGAQRAFEMAVDQVAIRTVAAPLTVPALPGISLWVALLFAFIGGLILNLMPCVLPVLSIKVLSLVDKGGDRKKALLSSLFFALGVLVSFWILAGLLITLKALGRPIGWGFQFQSPVFLIIMCLVLFVFALNLWGLFAIDIFFPQAAAYINRHHGYGKTFFSGVLAVLLATPCTAPFMGTAIGFAITQDALRNFLIFTFLALGFAFPVVLLSMSPRLLKFVPRPGPWMNTFKRLLALLLVGTIAWLIWVLSHVVDSRAPMRPVEIDEAFIPWMDYSPELMRALREEGKIVFLDFTAKWCLSCQVNEQVVLRNKAVVDKFQELGVSAVKADWTRFDGRITRALAELGKNSIPVYVIYYGQDHQHKKVLPEIITPAIVLEALESVR